MKNLVVITGGTKGIGRALVNRFAGEGFAIATCSRDQEDLNALKVEINQAFPLVKLYVLKADLSNRNEVNEFATMVKQTSIPVDVLVNNTGTFVPGQVHQEDEGVLEQMINTNLYSAYHLTRALVHGMIDRKQGHIFNMCSTASITPYVNGGSYCISKFALLGMSKVLREELKELGIKVTSILPGATYTASWEGTELPKDRFMKAEDIAEAVFAAYQLSDTTVLEELILRPQLGDL